MSRGRIRRSRAPRPVTCTPCGKRGVPLLRVWGYPTPALERRADAGLVRLMGCLVPPSGLEDAAQWECRHCGAELLLDADPERRVLGVFGP